MDIRALRYFLGIAQSGSLSRAADRLNVAQPALSRHVQKLEEEIGAPLLIRHSRGIELTATGALLVERAEEVLNLLTQIRQDLRGPETVIHGHVTLGIPPATGLILVPEMMALFEEALPQVTLNIREGVGSSLLEWLQDGRVDFALVHNPPAMPDLYMEPLVTERMVVVLPPEHVATSWVQPGGPSISLAEAVRLPVLMPSRPHTNRMMIERILARNNLTFEPRMEIDSISITKELVARGLGVTFLTYSAVYPQVAEGKLRALMIDRPAMVSTISLVRRKASGYTAALEWGERIMRRTLMDVVRSGRLRGAHETENLVEEK